MIAGGIMIRKYLEVLRFRSYDKEKEKINTENKAGIALILVFYSIILILNVAGVIFSHQNVLADRNLVLEMVYMVIAVPLYFFVFRKRKMNFTALIYVFEVPLLLITIMHGTFWDPGNLTFTFLLFLLVLPLLILDKPWRVVLLILSMTFIYIGMDYMAKDPQLFSRDLMHVFNTCLMSVSATLYTLAVRIQNIEYAGYFAEKADLDPLTGLFNRFGAERRMRENEPGLMVYMDLDRFKEVNDDFGHSEGDHVLQETAAVLKSCFRRNDVLIRMGGDEFAVFAPGEWKPDEISRKLAEINQKINGIHSSDGTRDISMTVSIGCAYTPDGTADPDDLMRVADQKMYEIKRSGKDSFGIVTIEKEAS